MHKHFTAWLNDPQGDMVESALTMPLLILVTLAFVNLALAGFASVTANNAVNYATRLGQWISVHRGPQPTPPPKRRWRRHRRLYRSGHPGRRLCGRAGVGDGALVGAQLLRRVDAPLRRTGRGTGRRSGERVSEGGMVRCRASSS